MKIIINNIIVPLNANQNEFIKNSIEKLGIPQINIVKINYIKRSIDSRKKSEIKLVYNLEVTLLDNTNIPFSENIRTLKENISPMRKACFHKKIKIAVIGTGPAGLFAAYKLSSLGYSPIIFEQGEKIEDRDISIENFIKTSILNPYSNIQFGEGGAGTYSDGKLNTRIKSGYIDEVFQLLVSCGAQKEILWDYKPHIGTDILKIVVKNLREKIILLGGKFYFSSKLNNINVFNNQIQGIEISYLNGLKENFDVDALILATGHSSRETYRMLHGHGVIMENKAFAVGSRIEHSKEFINKLMFGPSHENELLGAATYSLTHNNREENRGIFSFCMCPGGVIVNAASEIEGTLVNGMSFSDRNKPFSNSALVVGIKENEFGSELFSGMNFQKKIEKQAYEIIGGYGAVYQNTKDFINDNKSKYLNSSSYEMNLVSENLNNILPKFVTDNMKSALVYWNKIHKGFVSEEANLIGPETRTSSPLKILRDLKGESLSIKGIYPIGEGAGYAGGITSAAVDGLKIIDLAFSTEV
ncbi:MAG: NAD(P)/FAD-dependent oxidoreductase [Fusobacteriaceae bacterium]